jgi:hypothetical protein
MIILLLKGRGWGREREWREKRERINNFSAIADTYLCEFKW